MPLLTDDLTTGEPSLALSVVVPAYNERHRIGPTLRDLGAMLARRGGSFELVVVDDGSTDGTSDLIESLARELQGLVLQRVPRNRGKGHAVRVGMLAARGIVRVMCDADGAMSAEQVERLVRPVEVGEADVVIGSRYLHGARTEVKQPLWRRAWSRMVHAVLTRRLIPGIQDAHCGYKAFSAEAAEDIFGSSSVDGWVFDLEVLALAQHLRLRIREVAVTWRDDADSRVQPLLAVRQVVGGYRALRRSLRRHDVGSRRRPGLPLPVLTRIAAAVARAAVDPERPVLVHLCVTRRCNLSCGYCTEYDNHAPHVPLEVLKARIDHLASLGTVMVNLNGGEPLLHPGIVEVVRHVRERGMFAVMNSNGFALRRHLVEALNEAGLIALQVSLDAVRPSETSRKACDLLAPKLRLLQRHARFRVRINTVLGSAADEAAETVQVAAAAMGLGFDAKCSFQRDELGAMLPLSQATKDAYQALKDMRGRSPSLLRESFMDELFTDGKRDWRCRSGARYFWVCEDGLVHFCESSYGDPGTPLADYGLDDVRRHFAMNKSCSSTCAVAYAHQVSRLDARRDQDEESRPVSKCSWMGGAALRSEHR